MKKVCILMLLMSMLFYFSCAKRPIVTVAPPQKAEKPQKSITVEEKPIERKPTTEELPSVSGLPKEEIFEEKISTEELARKRLAEEIKTFEAEDIHFDFDKYNIRPDAAEILKKKAEWLLDHPKVHILIEGHCDERGTEEYNLALGERRANSAKQFLVNLGVNSGRISIISYGEERPLDPRHCEEAWAKNRRCHFVVIRY